MLAGVWASAASSIGVFSFISMAFPQFVLTPGGVGGEGAVKFQPLKHFFVAPPPGEYM